MNNLSNMTQMFYIQLFFKMYLFNKLSYVSFLWKMLEFLDLFFPLRQNLLISRIKIHLTRIHWRIQNPATHLTCLVLRSSHACLHIGQRAKHLTWNYFCKKLHLKFWQSSKYAISVNFINTFCVIFRPVSFVKKE